MAACCDALGWLCSRNADSQQAMLRMGGSKTLFHLCGDGDLRSARLRGAASDAAAACASGWGNAEDAMNIVLL